MSEQQAPPVGEQLGDPRHHYFILCTDCCNRLEGEHGLMLAMFGPQGLTDEDAVLVCVPFEDRAVKSGAFACDSCKRLLAVAPSSRWFIERHRQEREG